MQKLGYEDGREEALMAEKRTLSEEVHHLRERVDGMTARYVSGDRQVCVSMTTRYVSA